MTQIRDVNPGSIVFIDQGGINTLVQMKCEPKYCSFNYIYSCRVDSRIDGIDVTAVRQKLGAALAVRDSWLDPDIIGPFPFSAMAHSQGYARAKQPPKPYADIFVPPQFALRTYIRPWGQRVREKKEKLIPCPENVKDKIIVANEDSIRSGLSTKGSVHDLKKAGAREVHVRVGSPPSIRYCPWAASPLKEEDYIAARMSVEEIRRFIGTDTLEYVDIETVVEAIGLPKQNLCLDCFKRAND